MIDIIAGILRALLAATGLLALADPTASGHSRFAATLEEHERNVAAYRQAQRSGGASP